MQSLQSDPAELSSSPPLFSTHPQPGIFTLSLDFELYWGLRDRKDLQQLAPKLLRVQTIVPRLLTLFEKFEIHATWGVVGCIFLNDFQELMKSLPETLPTYRDKTLTPYNSLEELGELATNYAGCLFQPQLIEKISKTAHQEIASHTFSHYYCSEEGQNMKQFEADLQRVVKVAREHGYDIRTLIFPREQLEPSYFPLLKEVGIEYYRSSPDLWPYRGGRLSEQSLFRRLVRLVDSFLPLSAQRCLARQDVAAANESPCAVPASFFLRPVSSLTKPFVRLQKRRLRNFLHSAAQTGQIFHLWWHPHNFCQYEDENFELLEYILTEYQQLQAQGRMRSLHIRELGEHMQQVASH